MTVNGLTQIDVADLDVIENPCDLRRDIHVFVSYVRERDVKRAHRTNQLSKGDAARLVKLMSDPQGPEDVVREGQSGWLDFVDGFCLQMGFISYDTKGEYQGYSSYAPSFPDNYIQYHQDTYNTFLDLSPADQESRILSTLIESYEPCSNEFFQRTPLSMLDPFGSRGCALGVLAGLDFAAARRFMFELLLVCEEGVWYSTRLLIQFLKQQHPFFLIPKKPKVGKPGLAKGRYGNFFEHRGNSWGNRTAIEEGMPDAFERVEGRFVERFLEGIPLTLGYLDLAYGQPYEKDLFPSLGQLQGFRVRPGLACFIKGKVPPPEVSVQPNFEIHVESLAYPARLIKTLTPLADLDVEDRVSILKLQKKKVAACLAQNEGLDVVALLQALTTKALPQNVRTELQEWTGHAEAFTLYQGFGLLEGETALPAVEAATAETIGPGLRILSGPRELFDRLELANEVPLWIQHGDRTLQALPKSATSVFPKVSEQPKPKPRTVTLKRETWVTLHFPSVELLEIFREGLSQARCAQEVDTTRCLITFPKSCEGLVKDIVKDIRNAYRIRIKDIQQ